MNGADLEGVDSEAQRIASTNSTLSASAGSGGGDLIYTGVEKFTDTMANHFMEVCIDGLWNDAKIIPSIAPEGRQLSLEWVEYDSL